MSMIMVNRVEFDRVNGTEENLIRVRSWLFTEEEEAKANERFQTVKEAEAEVLETVRALFPEAAAESDNFGWSMWRWSRYLGNDTVRIVEVKMEYMEEGCSISFGKALC